MIEDYSFDSSTDSDIPAITKESEFKNEKAKIRAALDTRYRYRRYQKKNFSPPGAVLSSKGEVMAISKEAKQRIDESIKRAVQTHMNVRQMRDKKNMSRS